MPNDRDNSAISLSLIKRTSWVVLPHVGSATNETRGAMGRLQIENLRLHFAGKPVLTRVV